jgi:hypothetical protein
MRRLALAMLGLPPGSPRRSPRRGHGFTVSVEPRHLF